MANPTIQLSRQQIVDALVKFSPGDIKKMLEALFRKKLYTPPKYADIAKDARVQIRKRGLKESVAEEAVQWARAQKTK